MMGATSKVLVTGAGGFIGSHLVETLVKRGRPVRALVRYNARGRRGWLERSDVAEEVEFEAGDVGDPDCIERAMRGVDTIIHLAALIGIPYSYEAPRSYVRTNIDGTLNLLQEARRRDIRRFVHASTSEVYGSAIDVPISEAHALRGQSPYSASKIAADKFVEAFHLSFDVPVVTIRPFNVYGPRQSTRAIVPTIISQCLGGDGTVRLGNLEPTRDLTFVTDTVAAFILATSAEGVMGETMNVGSDNEISIGDLAETIIELTGGSASVVSDTARVRPTGSEVARLRASNEKAHELLGWSPQIALKAGLTRTIDWMRENLHHYRSDSYAI